MPGMETKVRRWSLGRRLPTSRRSRRVAVVAALVGLVAVPVAWWAMQLRGLPDIGDPFDVAAFEAEADIPDERNAFVVYDEVGPKINGAFRTFRQHHPDAVKGDMPLDWAKADPAWRDFLAEQRENLKLWRVGSERPDARHIYPDGFTFHTLLEVNQQLRMLSRLAILEGSRLEAEGDMAGAWGWYRAVLKSSRHEGRHGFLIERGIGAAMHKDASEALTRWASDPRVDAPLLRPALGEVIAIDAATPPLSDVLKMEYLVFRNSVYDPSIIDDLLVQKQQGDPTDWSDDPRIPDAARRPILVARMLAADDRERSLRVVRLMAANWLAQVDKPPGRRSKVEHGNPIMYAPEPDGPTALHPLTTEELARWLDSSLLARRIASFQTWYTPNVDRERPPPGPAGRPPGRRASSA